MRLAWAAAAMAAIAIGQPAPDGKEILRKVSGRYAAAKSLDIAETVHVTTRRERDGEVARGKTVTAHAAFEMPDKYMVDAEVLQVSDGNQVWAYSLARNEYWLGKPDFENAKKMIEPFRYSDAIKAEMLREDMIGAVDCYVIEVHAPWTSEAGDLEWVDKARLVILRQENTLVTGGIVEITRADYVVKIDEPLPRSLFTFVPPPGAKRVESLGK